MVTGFPDVKVFLIVPGIIYLTVTTFLLIFVSNVVAHNERREIMLHTVEWLEKDSGISRHTWRSWIRVGKIPVIRLGRRVRVAEEDYRRFLAENRVPAREGEGK